MSDLIHLNDQNFEEFVKSSDVPVLVDFSASWCGPCKMLTPIVESLATELVGKAAVCKVDIDDAPLSAQKMGVRGVPTVIAFKSGEKTGTVVGLTSKDKLRALVE